MTMRFSTDENFARQLDAEDALRGFREKFSLPLGNNAKPVIYFAGNSLGLMPKSARQIVEEELDNWAKLGVDAHHATGTPWYSYHEVLREPMARLVGSKPLEVICMNSLTVNLHLMMATFYQPTKSRFKVVMEEPAFPSDTYAIKTQITHHGLDPKDALVLVRPRKGEFTIRTDDVIELIEKQADQLALVMLAGVNFFTGQLFDIEKITAAAQKHGIVIGFDLAHAAGNVSLALHDCDVDFAVWCSYKYLYAGPGAVAGAFVHERHATNTKLPRLAGWFGNDPSTRASKAVTRRTHRRRCKMRLSRAERDPRRADPAVQHLSRSLALCPATCCAQMSCAAALRLLRNGCSGVCVKRRAN